MNKGLKAALITVLIVASAPFINRIVFTRTVNYNIAGIDIPARYNIITRKAEPIIGYKGGVIKNTVIDRNNNKLGLDSTDVTAAQFRWALFEEWVKSQKQFKGWESDPELFKKANEEFKLKVGAETKIIK